MNTPPLGNPVVSLVLEVKKDLRAHIEKDERDTAYIRSAQDAQSRELGVQTVMLSQLLQEKKRKETIDDTRQTNSIVLRSKVWGWTWKAIIGIVAFAATTLLGAALHKWLS